MNNVNLTVNGSKYSGWKSININLGLEQLSGTFELVVSEKWPDNLTARKMRPGEACTVDIEGQIIITGYVDDVLPSLDSDSHSVSIKGRDKTGDLVDCSAIYKTGEWTNKKLDVIAANLCEPFGITVIVNTDIGEPFKKETIQQGETVFEILDRLARQRGVLLTSDGLGNLIKLKNASRRFVTRLKANNEIEIQFGAGTSNKADEQIIPNPDISKRTDC